MFADENLRLRNVLRRNEFLTRSNARTRQRVCTLVLSSSALVSRYAVHYESITLVPTSYRARSKIHHPRVLTLVSTSFVARSRFANSRSRSTEGQATTVLSEHQNSTISLCYYAVAPYVSALCPDAIDTQCFMRRSNADNGLRARMDERTWIRVNPSVDVTSSVQGLKDNSVLCCGNVARVHRRKQSAEKKSYIRSEKRKRNAALACAQAILTVFQVRLHTLYALCRCPDVIRTPISDRQGEYDSMRHLTC